MCLCALVPRISTFRGVGSSKFSTLFEGTLPRSRETLKFFNSGFLVLCIPSAWIGRGWFERWVREVSRPRT